MRSIDRALPWIFSVALIAIVTLGHAQDVRVLPAVSRTFVISNATVIQGPGRKIDAGTILIRDGLIAAVGKGLSIPPDATMIKGDSLYVYAGFIDGLSRVGVNKPKEEATKEKPKDPGNPPAKAAGITPYQDVRSYLNPSESTIEEWRAIGFTAANIVPYGGMLPGSGAVIFLHGGPVDKMVVVPKSTMYSELTIAERMYPNTILGVLAKWKELYRQASLSKSYSSLYASNRSGLESPGADRVLEAFYPVIEKQTAVLFKAEKNLDAQRVLALKDQLGFNLIVAELKEGWDLVPMLKSSTTRVFLSLDLPEAKKDKGKEDKEKRDDEAMIIPDSIERLALEKRIEDFRTLYVGQAATFEKAAVPFGFSGLSVKSKDVQANLRRMIKAGLSEDGALAALTTNPAQSLGLSDRLGTIDPGKIANLIISHKPYFNEKSKVQYVFIEGQIFKITAPKVEKPEGEKKPEKR
ncbi:MAG: amidohydrolase family protein [Chryseolinea sp.]